MQSSIVGVKEQKNDKILPHKKVKWSERVT